jgi:hypothetical protein
MAEHDAFISYSHDDKKFANWLLYELEDVGFKIFLYETDLNKVTPIVKTRNRER